MQHAFQRNSPQRDLLQLQQLKDKSKKLFVKKYQTVTVDEKKLIVRCIQDDNQPTIIRTTEPLGIHNIVTYFEVKINDLSMSSSNRVYIGLVRRDTNLRKFPGTCINSIGFDCSSFHYPIKEPDGQKQIKVTKLPYGKAKVGTVLGIGINTYKRVIFFTINGEKIPNEVDLSQKTDWNQFYPAVCVLRKRDTLQFIFSERNMRFKLKEYINKQEFQMLSEIRGIKNVDTSKETVFSLIHDYLFTNGYTQTLQMLEKQKPTLRKIDLAQVLVEKLTVRSDLNLQNGKMPFEMMNESDQQSDSGDENIKYLLDEQRPRKYTETQIVDLQRANRKYSDIRHESANRRKVYKQESQYLMSGQNASQYSHDSGQEGMSLRGLKARIDRNGKKMPVELHDFLSKQRIEIMRAILQENIELAIKTMKQKIPTIFELEDYLQTFMKGHIFIRKIKREQLMNAVKYAKQEKSFLKFQNNLFPIYNLELNAFNWVPLKEIFTLIVSPKNKEGCLNSGQFRCFSQYINQLILQKLGYNRYSRLQTCLNHLLEMQATIKSEEIINPLLRID